MALYQTPLPDLAALDALARKIAPLLQRGDLIALEGELGAGKTEFARYLLRARGIGGEIPSPTFTLLQVYETSTLTFYHFDLYRLKSASELDELGWDDALADGVVIAEWPERAETRLPASRLRLRLTQPGGERSAEIIGAGDWAERWGRV